MKKKNILLFKIAYVQVDLTALVLVVDYISVVSRIVPIFRLLQLSPNGEPTEKRRLTEAEIIRNIYLCIGPV